jgi:hypothetical protein
MVSTPKALDGLFERIEKEDEDICLYKRLFLDYPYSIVRYTLPFLLALLFVINFLGSVTSK